MVVSKLRLLEQYYIFEDQSVSTDHFGKAREEVAQKVTT